MRLFHSPKKFWSVLATVVVGTTLATVGVTHQTSNAAAVRQCNDMRHVICLFEDKNFNYAKPWLFMDAWDYTASPGCKTIRTAYRDRISSMKINITGSNKSFWMYGYSDLNCGRKLSQTQIGTLRGDRLEIDNLYGTGANDSIKSIKIFWG